MTDKLDVCCSKFSDEISKLQKHMELVYAQFKGAKLIRQSALTSDNVITLLIDWSENYNLKQAREERCIGDAIGATSKRLFDNAARLNPDELFKGAEDFMDKT
ncbi:unnamed protein product [Rotaria sp. Silwood2]|nr:unnamed protein product [Rotaria sp. Silwood2]CAF2865837.1 unnamed protein product [Rotaria sp. Silwood2]CAF4235983.1 unnamed protein product [Rotaria sp. Silwood2]CAF4583503.1 unnamed protein product [Rotaria sp. Silwood2]